MNFLSLIPPEVYTALAGVLGTALFFWLRARDRAKAQHEVISAIEKKAAVYRMLRTRVREAAQKADDEKTAAQLTDGPTSAEVAELIRERGDGPE